MKNEIEITCNGKSFETIGSALNYQRELGIKELSYVLCDSLSDILSDFLDGEDIEEESYTEIAEYIYSEYISQ